MQSSISKNQDKNIVQHTVTKEEGQSSIRWTWACRLLGRELAYEIQEDDMAEPPSPGDLALFRVTRIGMHTRIINILNQKVRIYPGDIFVGVFGNRYAT